MRTYIVVAMMFIASFAIGQTKPVVNPTAHKAAPAKVASKKAGKLSAKVGPHSTSLSWNPTSSTCSGTLGYDVYTGPTAGSENYSSPLNTALLSATSFVDTAVVVQQTKFYTVKTYCSTATTPLSNPSNEVSGTTPGDPQPNPPTSVTATVL